MNIRELAKAVGFSVSTVSRALNGYTDVNAETRAKIAAFAAELGYVPHPSARGLRQRATGLIAFVLSPPQQKFVNPFFLDLLLGIDNKLRGTRFQLIIVSAHDFKDEQSRFVDLVEHRHVEGLLFARTRRQDPRIAYLSQRGLPFVTHGRTETVADSASVDIDQIIVGETGCARFIALGHRRIGLLNTQAELMNSRHRELGYRSALAAASIKFDPNLMITEELTEEGGARGMRTLLSQSRPPSAILCGNDILAMGAMRTLRERGLTPGQDVGIIGCGDHPIGPYISPPLTTFTAPRVAVGERMAELLIDLIEGRTPQTLQEVWTPEFVIRASDGPRRVPVREPLGAMG